MKQIFFIIIVFIGFNSCFVKDESKLMTGVNSPITLSDSSEFSQGVFFTSDNNENPVIVWSSAKSDSGKYTLNYRLFDDNKKDFGVINKVAETKGMQAHHESMAKLGFKKNGDMIAVYRRENTISKRRFAGELFFVESSDRGYTWGNEGKLVSDTTSSSQSFYDVARLANGEIGLTWLDSRKIEEREGSSIFFNQTSSTGGFVKEVGVVGSTCQCCRTELEVDKFGKINIAFRDILNDSIRDMVYVFSENNGASFSKGKRISNDNWIIKGCPHTGPSIATNNNQRAIAWYTMGGGKGVYFTVGHNASESSPERILIDQNATHPQMIWAKDHFYLCYELRSSFKGAIYRQIVVTLITRKGLIHKTIQVSDTGIDSQMPVISLVDEKHLIIAWVENNGNHQSIIKAKLIKI